MRASLNLALSIGLTATFMFASFVPTCAENASTTTNSKENTASTTSEAAKSKLLVTQSTSPYADFDARLVKAERRLVDDLATGRLTPEESEELRKALDQIAELEDQYRVSSLPHIQWRILKLHILLDKFNEAVGRTEHDRSFASADLQSIREDLQHRIELGAKDGRLAPQEVADLKSRFNKIYAIEASLKKSKEGMTYLDKMMLSIDYDHLSHRLEKSLSDRPIALPDIPASSLALEKQIDEASKAGKLTETQVHDFKQQISDLRTNDEAFKKAGGILETEQIVTLGLSLDTVKNRVATAIDAKSEQSLAARLLTVDHKLANALNEGSLTPLETLELKEDLDSIAASLDKLKTAGSIKESDQDAQRLDLARLEGRLDRQSHGPSRLWSGNTTTLVHLSFRTKDALTAKRLSDTEATDFNKSISLLNKQLKTAEQVDGGLSCSDSLQIAEDIQRLTGRLEKTYKDRDLEIPNIDGLRIAIDSRIAESAVAGTLSAGDARSAVLDLGELNSVKERYHTSDSGLSSREKLSLAFELNRLSSELEDQMHGHAALFPGLDRRRSQIEALIYEGLSSGRLSKEDADAYKQKLADSNKFEKQYRSDPVGLTGDKAVDLVVGLERLWELIDRNIREQYVLSSDIVSLEGNLEKRIRIGASTGLLSPAEANILRADYDALVSSFNKMRASDGGLSYGERLAFIYGFQRAIANVERNMRQTPIAIPNLDARRLAIERKLGSFLSTGHIPVQEAQIFKALLDESARASAESRGSGGGQSYQESILLAVNLERLNKRIDTRIAASTSSSEDIDTLQQSLDKKVELQKTQNKMSHSDYNAFKSELDRIAANEATFRISDEALDYAEAINLVLELNRVKDNLSMWEKNSSTKDNKSSNSKTSKDKPSAAAKQVDKKKSGIKTTSKKVK